MKRSKTAIDESGWKLAPVYDLNPVPEELKPRVLSTAITFDSADASLELALDVAEEFGLKSIEAKRIAREVGEAVSQWRQTAKQIGLPEKAISKLESAFEHSEPRNGQDPQLIDRAGLEELP